MNCASKFVPVPYVPLSQDALSGVLLDTTYNTYGAKARNEIQRNASLLGLTIYGDGETVD